MSQEIGVTSTEVFAYLDKLRDSGETNMFGARPYLMAEFGLTRQQAGGWLSAWMARGEPEEAGG